MMKAAVVEDYGNTDVIKIKDIDIPILKDDEMLIKVYGSSANTADTERRKKPSRSIRLFTFLLRVKNPKPVDTGLDVSGEIISIGKDITKFKIGDQVYGGSRTGACAEFAKASEKSIAQKPKTMNYLEAAAVPVAGLTAFQYLRNLGQIRNGQEVLIYGASGGVGTYAIQYAKTFDTKVTAVCRGKNEKLVRELGADDVIDYTKEDFTKLGKKYDIIIDCVGKSPQKRWKKALKKEGIFLQVGSPNLNLVMLAIRAVISKFRKKKMKFTITKILAEDLTSLASLIDEGKIKSVIDKIYPLDKTAEAQRYYEQGHSVGKVVIEVGH